MVRQLRVNGFTLVEMLIVLVIVSIFTISIAQVVKPMQYRKAYRQLTDALYAQSLSMIDDSTYTVEPIDGCDIGTWFYHPGGTVNQANTYTCGNDELVVHLGSGNVEIERLY